MNVLELARLGINIDMSTNYAFDTNCIVFCCRKGSKGYRRIINNGDIDVTKEVLVFLEDAICNEAAEHFIGVKY